MGWNGGPFLRLLEDLSKRLTRRGLNEFLEQSYAEIKAGARVLSVGAGGDVNARLGRHAALRGFRVTSLDVDPSRGPDLLGDVCTRPLPAGAFDVVVMGEVLEHVHSPHLALRNVRRALADGGTLILTTPFLFPIHNRPVDYYRFTRYGLEFLLRDYREVEVRERNSWAEAINVLFGRLYREPGPGPRLLGPLLLAWAYLSLPLAILAGRLVGSDAMTTGYVATARK